MERLTIISLTPGLTEAVNRAQRIANETGNAHGVWEHVGSYGLPTGDVPARHTFRVVSFNRPDMPNDWALVACVDPEGV